MKGVVSVPREEWAGLQRAQASVEFWEAHSRWQQHQGFVECGECDAPEDLKALGTLYCQMMLFPAFSAQAVLAKYLAFVI